MVFDGRIPGEEKLELVAKVGLGRAEERFFRLVIGGRPEDREEILELGRGMGMDPEDPLLEAYRTPAQGTGTEMPSRSSM